MREKKTLPEYLRELRRGCRYKQDFVASCLHITRQTYSHYETGRIKPPASKMYSLAKLYGVPVERMLACAEKSEVEMDSPEQEKAGWKAQGNNQGEEIEWKESMDCSKEALLYYFGRLSDKDKMEIISLMKIKEKYRMNDIHERFGLTDGR